MLWDGAKVDGLYRGDKYEVNHPLLDAARLCLAQGYKMVVWTGGGIDYAYMWARRVVLPAFPEADYPYLQVGVAAKDISLPQPEDVCVDDEWLNVPCLLFKPADFIKEFANGEPTTEV